jgi:ABC-type nitrate/sulfonate/bicarbonate transport system permease component
MARNPAAPVRRDAFGKALPGKRERQVLAIVAIVGALGFWALISASGLVEKVLLPSPLEVVRAIWASAADGSLAKHVAASFGRVVQGFLLAFAFAVPVGVLMGSSHRARGLIDPLIELLRPIPPIAMIPLAILWFGIGELSKVVIIGYGAFFPILVNTMAGFREVDPVHIRAAQTLGASRSRIFRDVVLRSAFPFIVVGARLGMGMAFIVLVAAELIASSEGLGFLINDARYNFQTDQVFLGMVCIGILGFLLNRALIEVERRLLGWKYVTE